MLYADDWRHDTLGVAGNPVVKTPNLDRLASEGMRFTTKYQEMMKNYYRLASEVDATCGRVIEELKKQGLLDSTLIIFVGDNGYFHGEHGLADKWYPHQNRPSVPLIIRDPRLAMEKRGTRICRDSAV